jgi:hypothetical protein
MNISNFMDSGPLAGIYIIELLLLSPGGGGAGMM